MKTLRKPDPILSFFFSSIRSSFQACCGDQLLIWNTVQFQEWKICVYWSVRVPAWSFGIRQRHQMFLMNFLEGNFLLSRILFKPFVCVCVWVSWRPTRMKWRRSLLLSDGSLALTAPRLLHTIRGCLCGCRTWRPYKGLRAARCVCVCVWERHCYTLQTGHSSFKEIALFTGSTTTERQRLHCSFQVQSQGETTAEALLTLLQKMEDWSALHVGSVHVQLLSGHRNLNV